MRIHRLSITAFGPFAGTVEVDFDALTEASLFLLCGDTGAGKTTVLDAVCFALYGDVPSDRGAARQLRSQHADPGVAPQVVLETTLGVRRFRLTRSPAWRRPKKRGTGLTTEQPRVLVEELIGAEWRALSTRLDEAGHLVSDLLGMTLAQFTQVALLPQGQFDTFLRASSEERQRVLTQLFRTRRFEDVERWLVERRTSLRHESDRHRSRVVALLHRISESAEADLDLDDDPVMMRAWADATNSAAEARREQADAARTTAELALREQSAALHDARALTELQRRHREAATTRASLDAVAVEAARDTEELDAGRRGVVVAPVLAEAADTAARLVDAVQHSALATSRAAARLDDSSDGNSADEHRWGEQAQAASRRAALVEAFLPRARELEAARSTLTDCEERLRGLVDERARLVARSEQLPEQRHRLESELFDLRIAAASGSTAASRVASLSKQLTLFATADELEFQVTQARDLREERRNTVAQLRDRVHDLREARLHGMAAELAGRLAVGNDCPVCGSHDHPALATPAPGAPTRDQEQQARRDLDDAEVTLASSDDTVHGYTARLAAVRESLGEATVATTHDALTAAEDDASAARTAAERIGPLAAEIDALETAERATGETLHELEEQVGRLSERGDAAAVSIDRLGAELHELLGSEGGLDELEQLHATSTKTASMLAVARDALVAERHARDVAGRASATARRVAREQGFDDTAAAAAALRSDRELIALAERVARRETQLKECDSVLADPEIQAAAQTPAPDLVSLTAAQAAASTAHGDAGAAHRSAVERCERLARRVEELHQALDAWAPLREEHAVTASLAELAEGKGADNTRQMRLSAYVLAARLTQVVSAANERLARMSDARYLLEHTAQRGVGERRGGLSLLVRDQWTDEARDPVTLSGGETFVVSLALALGLSDVVSAEAGGIRVDTLFVDEGFGSLDADTLELVMDTLDQLRAGGRAVGVVSHVPDLRDRIPTQLRVGKSRAGSSLVQVRGETRG